MPCKTCLTVLTRNTYLLTYLHSGCFDMMVMQTSSDVAVMIFSSTHCTDNAIMRYIN